MLSLIPDDTRALVYAPDADRTTPPARLAVNALARDAIGPGSARRHTPKKVIGNPLVVVAGLPGAGKSTALKELAQELGADGASSRPVVLDSASVHRWLRSQLAYVPYPILRPVVHATHWARIMALALTEPGPLIVHETATRPLSRQILRALARYRRRPPRMVWIDVPPQVALRGQVDRRRVIRPRAFARHVHWVEREHPVAAARRTWDAVYVTDRTGALAAIIAACFTTCSRSSRR